MNKPLGSEKERVGQKKEITDFLLIKPGRGKEMYSGKIQHEAKHIFQASNTGYTGLYSD